MILEIAFIFFARIIDVSLGTVRMILTIRGDKLVASIVGFFEITVYILALNLVLKQLNDPVKFFAYALGFACGIYIGSLVEEKMALGFRGLQVILSLDNAHVTEVLRDEGYAVTTWDGQGMEGHKLIMNIIVRRNRAAKCEKRIMELDPNAFIVFLEPKSFSGGYLKK